SSEWSPPLQWPCRRRVRTSFWLPCPPPNARTPHGLAIGVATCPRPRDEREWRKDSQKKFFICRILGPIPDVIYRGDNSGGPMSAFTAGKPLDREAFDRLVGELRPKLHRYCARMTGSVLDGEDVVHEAILKAIEALSQPGSIAHPEAWLFRIAHNAALDFLRH